MRLTIRRRGKMTRAAWRHCSAGEVVDGSSGVVGSWTGLLLWVFAASGWLSGKGL